MASRHNFTPSPRNAPEPPPVGQIINPRAKFQDAPATRDAFALWT